MPAYNKGFPTSGGVASNKKESGKRTGVLLMNSICPPPAASPQTLSVMAGQRVQTPSEEI